MGKEVIIKIVPTPGYVFYIVSTVTAVLGIKEFLASRYSTGIAAFVCAAAFLFFKKLEPKKAKEVIKITDEKLWIRHCGYKSWDAIICIKFRFSNKDSYMDVYRTNEIVADDEVDLRGINMPIWRLKWILKKYTRVENH